MRLNRIALLFACLLAGCGGGGGSVAPNLPGPAATARAGSAALTVRIDVPLTGTGTASTRRPAYISAGTQSLAIAINSTDGTLVGAFSVNITPGSSSCQTVTVTGTATLTCTFNFPVALPASGTFMVGTATFDQPQTQQCSPTGTPACAGKLLSASLISTTLSINATNVLSIALGGLAASFTVTPVPNGYIRGNVAGLHIFGPQTQSVVVQALDAAGFTIAGNGTPSLTLTAASPVVQITPVSTGMFTIQPTVSGSPPVVTRGTIPLTVTATPVGNPATPFSQTVPLAISHTAVFVSNNASVPVYLDGNTTPSLINLGTVSSPRGIAVDANGTVYVGNHVRPGSVTECSESSGWTSCSTPISNQAPFIEGVAIDATGNLWLTANGSEIFEYPAGQTSPLPAITTGLRMLRGIAVDPSGNVWVANKFPSSVAGFVPPSNTPFATLSSGIDAPYGLSVESSGDLWVANCGNGTGCRGTTTSAEEFRAPIVTGAAPSSTVTAGLSGARSVAIDATGGLWIASRDSGGSVMHCAPATGGVCNTFSAGSARWIAVYPSAIAP
jgi:hypothetical protein